MVHFEGVKKLGILLKGKSIEKIAQFEGKFQHAFIVNNFDLEYDTVRPHLDGVEIIQFVNKLGTAVLTNEHYSGFGIKTIQTNMALTIDKNKKGYRKLKTFYPKFLKIHSLPQQVLKYNEFFTRRGVKGYVHKHPNTGLLAICYSLEFIKPEEMYICGLDFYQADYKFRRPHQNPQRKQQKKMKRTHMVEHFVELVTHHPKTRFIVGTYYEGFPSLSNLEVV